MKLITSAAMAALSAAATMAAEKTGQLIDTLTAAGDRRFFVMGDEKRSPGRQRYKLKDRPQYQARPRKMPRAGWPAGTKLYNKARAGMLTLRQGW